jgi:hypothetical protein
MSTSSANFMVLIIVSFLALSGSAPSCIGASNHDSDDLQMIWREEAGRKLLGVSS